MNRPTSPCPTSCRCPCCCRCSAPALALRLPPVAAPAARRQHRRARRGRRRRRASSSWQTDATARRCCGSAPGRSRSASRWSPTGCQRPDAAGLGIVTLARARLLHRPGQVDRRRARRHAAHDLPPDVPGARGRRLQRLPRRRPVQPLRRLRDPAVRSLRAASRSAAPRRGSAPARSTSSSACSRSTLFLVAHRRDVRRHRHGQPGPARRCASATSPGVAARAPAAAAHRVRIKAAVFPLSFWLPDSYPTAPGAGHRGVRRPADQGRRLRDHPHPDPAVPRQPAQRPAHVGGAADHGRRHPRRGRAGRASSGCCRSRWSATSAT